MLLNPNLSRLKKKSAGEMEKQLIPIKTKVNYPFIYFLIEPNAVFVYQMKTNNYLTISNFSKFDAGLMYEINNRVEFEKLITRNTSQSKKEDSF